MIKTVYETKQAFVAFVKNLNKMCLYSAHSAQLSFIVSYIRIHL